MPVKNIISCLILFAATFTVCAEQPTQWHFLGAGKNNAISGITTIDAEHFLVAMDGRKPEHPRLAILDWKKGQKPVLNKIDWCDQDNFPEDMEAVTQIPNQKEYLLLESKGSVTRIQLAENNHCKITAQFELPNLTADTNMEGLALHCFAENCFLVWAERGDDKMPAKVSWAHFDIAENELDDPKAESFEFKAPYPLKNLRSISDLAIDAKGQLWAAATSDPGDEGPFSSAIYHLGAFEQHKNHVHWKAAKDIKPVARYEKDNVKIEGITFTAAGLLMGSEDENLGGKVAVLPVK